MDGLFQTTLWGKLPVLTNWPQQTPILPLLVSVENPAMSMGKRSMVNAVAGQYAGIEALDSCDAFIAEMLALYGRRRERVLDTLRELGWNFDVPKGTFYLWAPVPKGYSSAEFCDFIFEKTAVVLAPGAAYGANGEGYVRFSLTVEDDRLDEALARLRDKIGYVSF